MARELVTMMADGAHTTIEIASDRFTADKPQSYTIVRAKLDQWLAEKVTEKGAMVVPNMKVDELLRKDGRVIGIRAGDDEIGANVVIVAEGVLRLLSSAAGLAAEPQAKHHALGYKEIIELPAGVIEDRWHLNPGEGAAQLFMGECTKGMMGGGFLYTNKESISLGMVVGMEAHAQPARRHGELAAPRRVQGAAPDPAAGRRRHRRRVLGARDPRGRHQPGAQARRRRLSGGRRHRRAQPQRARHRARHGLRHRRGYFAAEAVKKAKAAGDFSAAGLASYEASLRDSFVLKDLETARAIPSFMENPRLFTHYPKAVSALLESIYTIDEQPQAGLFKKAWKGVKKDFMNVATVKDAWSMRKI